VMIKDILFPHKNKVSELNISEKEWHSYIVRNFNKIIITSIPIITGGILFYVALRNGINDHFKEALIDTFFLTVIITSLFADYIAIRWKIME